jgi:hypothetical protein
MRHRERLPLPLCEDPHTYFWSQSVSGCFMACYLLSWNCHFLQCNIWIIQAFLLIFGQRALEWRTSERQSVEVRRNAAKPGAWRQDPTLLLVSQISELWAAVPSWQAPDTGVNFLWKLIWSTWRLTVIVFGHWINPMIHCQFYESRTSFFPDWGLNSGPYTCETPLEPHMQSFFVLVIFWLRSGFISRG